MAKLLEGNVVLGATSDMKRVMMRLMVEDIITLGQLGAARALGLVHEIDVCNSSVKACVLMGVTAEEVVDESMSYPNAQEHMEKAGAAAGLQAVDVRLNLVSKIEKFLAWGKESLVRHPDVWRLKDEGAPPPEGGEVDDGEVKVPKRGDLQPPA